MAFQARKRAVRVAAFPASERRGSGMLRPIREFLVTVRPFLHLALIGVLALPVSACGRKGGLDPPPRTSAQPAPGQPGQAPAMAEDEHGNPIVSQGQKKPFPLDAILN